jgi:type VI secretion system protein ImpM
MFGFLKKGRSDIGKVEGFGKIPSLGDFVRASSPSEEVLAFEGWLARAMERGEERGGNAFKEAFLNGPALGFVWSGPLEKGKRGLLGGVLQPSRDAVGRRFPIVIAVPLPLSPFEKQPHAAALALHDFFADAASAAARARGAASAADFTAQVSSVQMPKRADGAVGAYDAWTSSTRAADLWRQLYGDDAERGARWALYLLVEAVRPYRGQELPPLALGMRVPLGPDRRHTGALWIDLVRNAAGWKTTIPSAFFPMTGADGALIQLGGEAPASVLEDIYTPDADSESVCDAIPAPTSKMPSSMPDPVTRATASTAASLSDVVSELAKA